MPERYRAHEAALLYDHELNPAPAGIAAFSLWTRDGKRIRYARTRTTVSPCRGTVVIFIGRNECIEKYHETTADLLAAGLDVLSFDWRGQGDSEHLLANRQKGYVRRFSDYVLDVEAILRRSPCPIAARRFLFWVIRWAA
ncbi:MAG: alpha/beta hydrolase [Phyllobacteriaceae bacterium]|nr:alpha/beta hydrolase [Phyllobacteriaceae bacterium]